MTTTFILIGFFVVGAFFLLNVFGGKNDFSKEDVIGIIQRVIDNKSINNEWDDFESVPFKDPFLEDVRKRCSKVLDEFPEKGKWCSDKGMEVLKLILKELREKKS